MAATEEDRIRLEGVATSVIGAVVDFYERHLQERYEDHVEELRGMKRVVMGQHNTYIRAWSLWTLTKCKEDLQRHWQTVSEAEKNGDAGRSYEDLVLRVNGLIADMERHVKRGVYGFLEQMSYDMCKILQLTAAASIYEFDMQRYKDTPDGLNRVGDIAQELGKNRDLGAKQTNMVSEEMQSLFAQNVRVNRLFHTRYDLDVLDAGQLLRLHGPMTEIISRCEKLASLRVTTGAPLYQHTLEFRRYLSARFGYAESMGQAKTVEMQKSLHTKETALQTLSQNSEMSPISALLARLTHYT
jgi:hypothetical protein